MDGPKFRVVTIRLKSSILVFDKMKGSIMIFHLQTFKLTARQITNLYELLNSLSFSKFLSLLPVSPYRL